MTEEMEIRFIVVYSSKEQRWFVDNTMSEIVFTGADIWLPEKSEWVRVGYSPESELFFSNTMRDLIQRVEEN